MATCLDAKERGALKQIAALIGDINPHEAQGRAGLVFLEGKLLMTPEEGRPGGYLP